MVFVCGCGIVWVGINVGVWMCTLVCKCTGYGIVYRCMYAYGCVCGCVWGLLKFVCVEGVVSVYGVHLGVYSCVWRVCGVCFGSYVVYLVCSCVCECVNVLCVSDRVTIGRI